MKETLEQAEREYARARPAREHFELLLGGPLKEAAVRGAFEASTEQQRAHRAQQFLAEFASEASNLDVSTLDEDHVTLTLVARFAEAFHREIEQMSRSPKSALFGTTSILDVREVAAAVRRAELDLDPLSPSTQAAVLDGRGLIESLEAIYPAYPLATLDGNKAPTTTFAALPSEWDDLESAIDPALQDFVSSENAAAYRAWLFDPAGEPDYYGHLAEQDRGSKWNDPTYRLLKMSATPAGWRLTCGMGWYFESLATSEVLDSEMMRSLAAAPSSALRLRDLPRRAWVHDRVADHDPILDGSGRSAALSVATVTMYRSPNPKRRGEYDVILSPRAKWVARHKFYNHVAPSGIFQPLNRDSAATEHEFSVRTTLVREILEELYGRDDYDQHSEKLLLEPEREPEIQRLDAMIADGSTELLYTGISVNLLSLRREICTLLLVHDPDWIRDVKLSREYLGADERLEGNRHHLTSLSLDESLRPVHVGSELRNWALIPNAAAALSLALPVARSRI